MLEKMIKLNCKVYHVINWLKNIWKHTLFDIFVRKLGLIQELGQLIWYLVRNIFMESIYRKSALKASAIPTLYAFFKMSQIKIKRKDIHKILSYISILRIFYGLSLSLSLSLPVSVSVSISLSLSLFLSLYIYIYIYIYILFLSSPLFPFVVNCPRWWNSILKFMIP